MTEANKATEGTEVSEFTRRNGATETNGGAADTARYVRLKPPKAAVGSPLGAIVSSLPPLVFVIFVAPCES